MSLTNDKGYDVALRPVAKNQKHFEDLRDGIVTLRGLVYPDLPVEDSIKMTKFLDHKHSFGVAAVLGTRVVGYLIGAVSKKSIEIYDIAVLEDMRRARIATDLLGFLVARIMSNGENSTTIIHATVREHNLVAQLFLQHFGASCKKTRKRFFEDTDEDGYVFKLKLPAACKA